MYVYKRQNCIVFNVFNQKLIELDRTQSNCIPGFCKVQIKPKLRFENSKREH